MSTKPTKSSNRTDTTKKQGWLHVLPWGLAAVLLVVLLVGKWGPISKAFGDWFDGITPKQSIAGSTQPASSVTVSTTPGGGSGTTTIVPLNTSGGSTPSGGSGSSNGGGSTTPTSGGGSVTTGGGLTDLKNFYSNIATGQTRQQLIGLAGGTVPDNCTTTQVLLLGTQQVCTWTDNNGTVVVTMVNDQVVAKQSVGL